MIIQGQVCAFKVFVVIIFVHSPSIPLHTRVYKLPLHNLLSHIQMTMAKCGIQRTKENVLNCTLCYKVSMAQSIFSFHSKVNIICKSFNQIEILSFN